jgi:hypothetical protein
MPRASILFTVPDDASRIAEILADGASEIDGREGLEFEDIVAHLASSAGRIVEALVDDDDPLTPVWDVAGALDGTGSAYWAVADAFVERSRGVRSIGRVLLNLDGGPGRTEMNVPWEYGEPLLDVATLEAAGMPRDKADEVVERFRVEAPAEVAGAPRG